MAPYHSHLEGLLKARKYQQEVVYRELIEQENLLAIENTQLQTWVEASEAALERLKTHQHLGGDPGEIQRHYTFIQFQAEKIKTQQEKIRIQKETVEQKRQELSEVVQEKKIVEKVESRQRNAYFERVKKNENRLLDEIAGRMRRKF
ncbi:MAG: flagellar export protein FliJ [Nitrospiria bacterium]